ncbi:hypothetical protein COU60_01255 [Candidatus Pacearchaeota archaeon CG10_big_fil_rev_8_21_14_0_10_34_76]|nr:MAG: hypothetical protein COU60_01255 [Candidatus Pacearchaeota archaeon CG10_big_fil_rev_8_21_14_0_10_34_76]
MNPKILSLIREKGILLEKDLFELLKEFDDVKLAGDFLEGLESVSGQKIITTSSLNKNLNYVQEIVKELPGEMKGLVERTFFKLGLSLEIKKEIEIKSGENVEKKNNNYQIFYADTKNEKKINVQDFVGHFRARYHQLQGILMDRPELQNLISINKISRERNSFNIIGIVSEKRKTKNGNLIVKFEDMTGSISALFKKDGDCFVTAEELQMDDVVAVKASGNNEMIFGHEIIFPDVFKDKVKFDEEVCIGFISDVHTGSAKHLGEEFKRFLEWIKSDDELAKKIKYLFFVGDNVDGVGVFPGQESLLKLTSLKEQYNLLASYLKEIPSDITMFMCPGQHDSVRVPEPQPVIDNYYGEALYEIPNLVLVSNPSTIKILEKDKVFKVLMYHGASIHTFINEITELRMLKAHKCPAKAVKHMLKRRHLAPMHGVSTSIVYVPNAKKDPLVISEAPDVLCTGEVHRLDIENYHGVLIITGSCWQAQTDFEEKVGNIPDPCKVPVLNLKTRELKILDFTGNSEENKNGH